MITIRRGSTPTITCHIPDDIEMEHISKDDLEHIISVLLTQEETLALKVGTAVLQVRLYFDSDISLPSSEETVRVLDVYKGGVMSSEN